MPNEKKSGGFFGALKSLVVEETQDGAEKPAATAVPAASRNTPVPAAPPMPPVPDAAIDKAAREKLESALTIAAPEGYREVTDTLSTLADTIPDERTRYTAMIKLLAKRGMATDHLLEDMDKAIGILEGKSRDFHDELEHQITKKVGGKQQAVADLDHQIEERKAQIAALSSEVDQLTARRNEEASGIEVERQKIAAVQAQFTAAYNAVHAGVKDRRDKLSTYGKGT